MNELNNKGSFSQAKPLDDSPKLHHSEKNKTPQEPSLLPSQTPISIKIVHCDQQNDCNFWIGLSKPGSLSPHSVLETKALSKIFQLISSQGFRERGPMMISDTEQSPPRFFFMTPSPHASEELQAWTMLLSKTIASWNPSKIGLYFDPTLSYIDSQLLLELSLKELILNCKVTDYRLFLGSHGLNSILNTALELKSTLVQQNIDLSVLH